MADLLGALLTLLALGLIVLGGFAAALLVLGPRARVDRLGLLIAALLLATAEAVGVATVLGAAGLLRLPLALGVQGALAGALALAAWRRGGLVAPARELAAGVAAAVRRHPFLTLVALHAGAAEAARGLLRPPLSWDSLMQHLWLAATWLQRADLLPPSGPAPFNYYGYIPANGALWTWWWLAPSHGELWVNLSSLPHWLLLGAAAGGVARRLGAGRTWPLAAFLVLLTPVVVRFATTQYVDLLVAGALLGGGYFALEWVREARGSLLALAAVGCGLAAGTKVLALAYVAILGGAVLLVGVGPWRRRAPQLLLGAAIAVALGGFFYARNAVLGAGPLAASCYSQASGLSTAAPWRLPRRDSVLAGGAGSARDVAEAFLGRADQPRLLELGVGPQVSVLMVALVGLPFGLGRGRRREGIVAAALLWLPLLLWLALPPAAHSWVYANTRYLDASIAIAAAGVVALAERRGFPARAAELLAAGFVLQGLLQLHPALPFGARVGLAAADLAAVILIAAPSLRRALARRPLAVLAVLLAAALLAVPPLARLRRADRMRSYARDLSAHATSAPLLVGAWRWLEAHAGAGAVAIVGTPFPYAVMGPRLERRAVYVNLDAADHPLAAAYPGCDPRRAAADRGAWRRNLRRHGIRWLYVVRDDPRDRFPLEVEWAEASPALLAERYADRYSRIYEVRAAPRPAAMPPGRRPRADP